VEKSMLDSVDELHDAGRGRRLFGIDAARLGLDCWSSRLAGRFEGWTQYNLFNRALPCPMSPMISWQAFAMMKIAESRKRLIKA
jgi:hypothetical protein